MEGNDIGMSRSELVETDLVQVPSWTVGGAIGRHEGREPLQVQRDLQRDGSRDAGMLKNGDIVSGAYAIRTGAGCPSQLYHLQ